MSQGTLEQTEPLEEIPPIPEKANRKGVKLSFLAGGALFIAVAVLGIYSRIESTTGLEKRSNEAAQIVVSVIHPEKASTTIPLQLPGQTRAYIETTIWLRPVAICRNGSLTSAQRLRPAMCLPRSILRRLINN